MTVEIRNPIIARRAAIKPRLASYNITRYEIVEKKPY